MEVIVVKHYTLQEGFEVVGVFSSKDKMPEYKDGDRDWYATETFELDNQYSE